MPEPPDGADVPRRRFRPARSADSAGHENGSRTAADERALTDLDQTHSDGDQTLSDADQTSSDSDQTTADRDQHAADRDQDAADRDQAASDHDLAAGLDPEAHEFSRGIRASTTDQREHNAQARLAVADRRDAAAHARDLAATARDQAADARDLTLAARDDAEAQYHRAGAGSGAESVIRGAAARSRAARQRAMAAEQRALAARDRRAAAHDRARAAAERSQALADRQALARELAAAACDALTGARTRAAGLTELDLELDRCRRTGAPLVVAYVDVVGLKAINDSEGHAAGDAMLKRVVAHISAQLRPYDLIIRLGGDEFLCAMSNVTFADARARFRLIAAAITPSPTDDGAIRTGFAALRPDDDGAGALMARADTELIAAGPSSRHARTRRNGAFPKSHGTSS
jgi:diguanylate cyclase (GGDEF)-like protein